ncbi:LytTR family transcriptional regulator DNA-binding domain-containing protein [Desulfosporosinus burensis]
MKLRVLLVDDDGSTRQELRYLLQPFDVQIVGEATNALEALELIYNLDYSLIFLDILMPGLNGIDLAHLLREKSDALTIIFTTAHEEYAFVFALNGLDYLLKPIHPKRLEETLINVRQMKGNLTGPKSKPLPPLKSDVITPPIKPLEVVPVELRGKIILLHQNDIIFIYTDKDKVFIKTQKDSYLTRFTLRELEERLNSALFFRSHRCYLVNTQHMRELFPYFNGTYTIVVDDHERSEIPVSRPKSRILKEMLGL